MASEPQKYQAHVDDCDSDDEDRVLASFTGRTSPNAANVSTKRSHPSDLDKNNKPPPPAQERVHANVDVRSDSGYSSYTTATVSSADSAPSASATSRRSPPVAPAAPAPVPSQNTAPKTRRPTVSESSSRQNSNTSSSGTTRPKPPSRTASQSQSQSQSSRRPSTVQRRPTITQDHREMRDQEYRDPPNALQQRRRPDLPHSVSARDVSYPAGYYTSPPSPTYTRQPTYVQGQAIVQPAPSRRRGSSVAKSRPMSYSGDPGGQYWAPGMPAPYPSPPQERGPPPSNSAYHRNMPPYGQMAPPMPPMPPQMAPYMPPHSQAPNGYYPPQHPLHQTSPPYDMQRPNLPSRHSSNYGARNGPAPIVTQERREPTMHSARYGPPLSASQPKDEAYSSDSQTEESESDEEYEPESDPRHARALMPPPKITKSKSSRPPMRRPNTTQVSDVDRVSRRQSQVVVLPERPNRERPPRVMDAPTRRQSVSRPPHRHTQSEYDTRGAQVLVNKSSRRQSTQMYDKSYEQYARARALEEAQAKAAEEAAHEERYQAEQRRKRTSVYSPPEGLFDDSEEEEEEEVEPSPAPLTRRRRPTDVDSRKGKERTVETKSKRTESAAEEYINAQRGSRDPYADSIHRAAKRLSQMPSDPSDSGSSRSKGSGKHTAVTNGSDEIRLRVDASAPLSLSFNGDMEGRTLQLVPAENGMADIVIGKARGGESIYHGSERGSVMGSRKALVASQGRREEDEITERSSRSGHSRRESRPVRGTRDDGEGQRHVLRRRSDYRD